MWCSKLVGTGGMPKTTQITWCTSPAAQTPVHLAPAIPDTADGFDEGLRIALGATIGAPRPIKDSILMARYALLKSHIPAIPPPNFSRVHPFSRQRIGHCAEDVPLIMMFR